MKKFAIIENNEVVGVIISEEEPNDERDFVEIDSINEKPQLPSKMVLSGTKIIWEVDSAFVREKRNQLLNDSDWIVVKALETNVSFDAWKIYRQKLRDLPQQKNFPNVDFPVPPDMI